MKGGQKARRSDAILLDNANANQIAGPKTGAVPAWLGRPGLAGEAAIPPPAKKNPRKNHAIDAPKALSKQPLGPGSRARALGRDTREAVNPPAAGSHSWEEKIATAPGRQNEPDGPPPARKDRGRPARIPGIRPRAAARHPRKTSASLPHRADRIR